MNRVSGNAAGVLSTAFYAGVATVALAGQTTAAVTWLGWPVATALPAVALLELGGIALAAQADYRRRLGESAVAARTLSAAVAVFAVIFQAIGHADRRQAIFFAAMSGLGYLLWLINSGARRRDQLRAVGMLPPTPPVYGWYRWLRRPAQTAQARSLALAQGLGLYASLEAVQEAKRAEQEAARQQRRQAAISAVLRRKVSASTDRQTAEIAVTVFDMDRVAAELAATADYAGLTGLIAADLMPGRLLGEGQRPSAQIYAPAITQAEPVVAVAATAEPVPDFSLADLMPVPVPAPIDVRPAVAVEWAQVPGQVLAEVGRELPAAVERKPAPRQGGTSRRKNAAKKTGRRPAPSPRRSAEETRRLAAEATATDPTLSRTEVARLLGITPRRLGQVLAGETARINGADVTTATP